MCLDVFPSPNNDKTVHFIPYIKQTLTAVVVQSLFRGACTFFKHTFYLLSNTVASRLSLAAYREQEEIFKLRIGRLKKVLLP